MREEVLRLENVTQIADGVTLLEDVNLQIYKGEIMGLICINYGGQDELVFDGASCITATDGQTILQLPQFVEALAYADLNEGGQWQTLEPLSPPAELNMLISWAAASVSDAGAVAEALIVGVSPAIGKPDRASLRYPCISDLAISAS